MSVPRLVPIELRIDVWDIAHQVQLGHRLRIAISSADVANHEPLLDPARNVVFRDDRYPSQLIVSVTPA